MIGSRLVVAALVIGLPAAASADDSIPGHQIDRAATGLVIAGALGASLGLSLIPLRDHPSLWDHELFGDDDAAVHANFSTRAAQLSDGLIAASVLAPVLYLTGSTIEDADGDRLLIYGETLAINLALFEAAKHLVQRPRPYLYSRSPEVARYAAAQGDDAYQSFYSGHAATAFAAATAGAYLTGASTPRAGLRALAWGGGFAVAAATANLRVRAGKHFYSDIVVGGLVGVAIGYLVPALHADAGPYVPSLADVGAALGGLAGGALISQLLPLPADPAHASAVGRWQLTPMPVAGGAGLAVGGAL